MIANTNCATCNAELANAKYKNCDACRAKSKEQRTLNKSCPDNYNKYVLCVAYYLQ